MVRERPGEAHRPHVHYYRSGGRPLASADGARTETACEAQARAATKRIGKDQLVDTWEDISTYNRCLSRAMPRVTQEYNQGAQILQTPGYVTIFYESMHDVRVIPLNGRPHLDSASANGMAMPEATGKETFW